jgi:hypothetical protein
MPITFWPLWFKVARKMLPLIITKSELDFCYCSYVFCVTVKSPSLSLLEFTMCKRKYRHRTMAWKFHLSVCVLPFTWSHSVAGMSRDLHVPSWVLTYLQEHANEPFEMPGLGCPVYLCHSLLSCPWMWGPKWHSCTLGGKSEGCFLEPRKPSWQIIAQPIDTPAFLSGQFFFLVIGVN